ncbi:MAG: hypothetical protein IPF63_09800 [Bacteroidetes bacterium]|nr:hypothetical protein [Bacteroidota bacterium]
MNTKKQLSLFAETKEQKAPQNQKEAFMYFMCKLDAEMVGLVLDDHKTYQDATKTVFISKLTDVFQQFIDKGDTCLMPYRGVCVSKFCNNNGCSGYSFYGNKSKMYIDLIVEESNNEIKDIYGCGSLITSKKIIKTSNKVTININNDEEADFKPSVKFLIASQKYLLAYEELLPYENTIIDKTIYLEWFEKYEDLNKSIVFDGKLYTNRENFSNLFGSIEILYNNLKYHEQAYKALADYKFVQPKNETQLLNWLTTYEQLGQHINLFSLLYMHPNNFFKSKHFEVDYLKIDNSDFKSIIKFQSIYDKFYYQMLLKYNTFSDEQIQQYREDDSDMVNYIDSLKYHLMKRNIDTIP